MEGSLPPISEADTETMIQIRFLFAELDSDSCWGQLNSFRFMLGAVKFIHKKQMNLTI